MGSASQTLGRSDAVEQFPDLGSEGGRGVRLADQVDAGVEATMMDDRVPGITCSEEHAQIGSQAQRFFGKLAAVAPQADLRR